MAEKNTDSPVPSTGSAAAISFGNGPAAVISSWKPGRAFSTSPARPSASAWIAPESASPLNISRIWG
ncbi:hypothetical protein V2I01_11005 [Micromonospora sp. BRA006-A]|nr:hypothetical protein [Micromonospora sp. BRA006-A]